MASSACPLQAPATGHCFCPVGRVTQVGLAAEVSELPFVQLQSFLQRVGHIYSSHLLFTIEFPSPPQQAALVCCCFLGDIGISRKGLVTETHPTEQIPLSSQVPE